MKLFMIALPLLAASCSTDMSANCRAPTFGLNSRHWKPAATDLKPCAVARRKGL